MFSWPWAKEPVVAGEQGPKHSPPPVKHELDWPAATIEEVCFGPDPDEQSELLIPTDTTPFALAGATGDGSRLFGQVTSLYDIKPKTGVRNGDPIADCYGGVTYTGGGALLVIADGCNWGPKPRKAARCAVYGVTTTFHQLINLHLKEGGALDTHRVFRMMREGLQAAQELITKKDGSQTTLTATVVAKLAPPSDKWAVMTMTVGDSSAYLLRNSKSCLHDLTYPARGRDARDIRITPGALGFVDGQDPDLTNLTLTLARGRSGDLVFLTSDGISDNFDPIARKQAQLAGVYKPGVTSHLPKISAATSHAQLVKALRAVLLDHRESPRDLVTHLINTVTEWTKPLRAMAAVLTASETEEEKLAAVRSIKATPGKLDHAACIAYRIPCVGGTHDDHVAVAPKSMVTPKSTSMKRTALPWELLP